MISSVKLKCVAFFYYVFIHFKPFFINFVQSYDGLIIGRKFPANAQFLNSVPQLKMLAVIGQGIDNVDIEEANSKGIAIIK